MTEDLPPPPLEGADLGGVDPMEPGRSTFAYSSLRKDSVAKFVATLSRVGAALLVTIVTARWLGPAGKGALSTLLYISVLMTYLCSLGIGEASIILIGRREASLQDAYSSSLGAALLAAPLGIAIVWVAYVVAGWTEIRGAVVAASFFILLGTALYSLINVENSRGRVFFTSVLFSVSAGASVVAAVLFVAILEFGVMGGVLASLVGAMAITPPLLSSLRKAGVDLKPRLDTSFLGRAFPVGAALEGTHLLTALAERFDLVLVYWLAGEAPAGMYSVALTIGYIVAYAPTSLSYAAFPRLAWEQGDSPELTFRIARMSLALGVITGTVLALITPFLVPLLLGTAFRPAIVPAVVLIAGGIGWGMMTALARAAAARGDTATYVASYSLSLTVMVMLDLVFVPTGGALAAAIASSIAPVVGLIACLRGYARSGWPAGPKDLLPTKQEFHDLKELIGILRSRLSASFKRSSS